MRKRVVLTASLCLLISVMYGVYSMWPRVEIKILETKRSRDGKRTAVVQMEIYETFSSVNDVVYAVRLKGPAQKDDRGDLVMHVPLNDPDPPPSVDWVDGSLMVTLRGDQNSQYSATSVGGVVVIVRRQ